MALTITIPGAVEATIGATAPAILTVGVGVPGATGATGAQGPQGDPGEGVPAGGSAGQFLTKIDGTNYNTDWTTINLSAYVVKANNLSDLANAATARTNLSLGSTNNVAFRSVNMSTGAANPSETYTYFNTTAVNNAPSLSLFNASYDDSGGGTFFVSSESFTLNKAGLSFLTYPTYDGTVPGAATSGSELYYTASTALLSIRNFDVGTSTDNTINISPTAITLADATSDSEMGGFGFGVQLSNDNTQNASLQYNGLSIQASGGSMSVTPTGIVFPDATTQTTAAVTPDLSGYAPLASPAFTGNPTAPTPATSDNDTSIATTAYVKAQAFGDRYLTSSTTSNTISNGNKTFTIGTGLSYTPTQNLTISYDAANHMHGEVLTYSTSTGVLTVDIKNHTGAGTYASWVVNVGGVTPATSVAFADITGAVSGNVNLQAALDLKANLASPTFTGTVTIPSGASISGFAPLASPALAGVPTAPTAAVDTNTTQLASTAYVVGQGYLKSATASSTYAPLASPSLTGTPSLPTGTTGVTQSINDNSTKLVTTAGLRDMLSDCTWSVPPITTTTTATSGTGAAYVNASPDYGYLVGPNINLAGFCQKNFLMFARSNSTYGFNFTKEIRVACKVAANWSGTFTAITQTLFFRLNTGTTNGTLSQAGFGISINMATKVLSILAHNGTTLTTKVTSWAVPYSGIASVDFMVKSDGTGTVYAYGDGVLIDSTTGMSTATASVTTQAFAQVEINSAGGTSTSGAVSYICNLRSFVAHG